MPLWKLFGNAGGTVITARPVVGGSGKTYKTIAAAIAGETDDATLIFTPIAGTGPGVVVGSIPDLGPVNDFWKDYWLVNEDHSVPPTKGLVCRYARVSAYDGATGTLTIDEPWDFSGTTQIRLVNPIRISILADMEEDVVFTKNVEFDLQGHRLKGKIDITIDPAINRPVIFTWIRGESGWVTNGIEKSRQGVLRIDDCNVSRRDGTIYAVLLTGGAGDRDFGRCEVNNCHFFGRVSARRGFMGWEIVNCRNLGVPDAANVDNLPYTLVESIAGVAVVVSQIDIAIDSEFGGACFYSEDSITGPTAWMSLKGNIRATKDFFDITPTPHNFSIFRARGAALLTPTIATGEITVEWSEYHFATDLTKNDPGSRIITVADFTGTATVTINIATRISCLRETNYRHIYAEGTIDMTGAVTLAGTGAVVIETVGNSTVTLIGLNLRVTTGSIIVSKATVVYGGACNVMQTVPSQNSGAPVFTVSGSITYIGCDGVTFFAISSVASSVGTWTISGDIKCYETVSTGFLALSSAVSGGSFIVSGKISGTIEAGNNTSFLLVTTSMTGGTISVTGDIDLDGARYSSVVRILAMSGTGGSATVSGSVTLRNFTTITWSLGLSGGGWAAGTATMSGAILLKECRSEGNFNILNLGGLAGPTFVAPASVTCENCVFAATFVTSAGSNQITWSGTLTWRNCHCQGVVTIVLGTHFTSIQAFSTTFNGNSGGSTQNSVTFTTLGTRPATYRYWKCTYAARLDAVGTPDIIDDYVVLPAAAALNAAECMTINATAQATPVVAGTTVVEGVTLAAVVGVGNPAVLVRRGQVKVKAVAATARGATCNADLAGAAPTSIITAAPAVGIRVGRTLEAVGATVAGQCYTAIDLR